MRVCDVVCVHAQRDERRTREHAARKVGHLMHTHTHTFTLIQHTHTHRVAAADSHTLYTHSQTHTRNPMNFHVRRSAARRRRCRARTHCCLYHRRSRACAHSSAASAQRQRQQSTAHVSIIQPTTEERARLEYISAPHRRGETPASQPASSNDA